jgi:hypothetical protein
VERRVERVSQQVITTIIIGCTIAALLLLLWRLTKDATGTDPLRKWEAEGHKVNVDGFRLLVDPDEAVFLWKSVPTPAFRRLQRKRIALALRSVQRMAGNAALLIRVATLARRTEDGEIASAADQLMFLCYRVRMNALIAEVYLVLRWIFPAWAIKVPMALDRYEQLLQVSISCAPISVSSPLSTPR